MKKTIIGGFLILCLACGFSLSGQAFAQRAEPRLALVIGNAEYRAGPLATAVNDAGLVADALRAAGFEVTGAANLDQDALRRAFRDFLARTAQAGPDAIVFVYLAGRGLQYEGENYFAPVEAAILRDADVPLEALRVSDFTRALAAQPLKARIVILDAARANAFAKAGQPFAGGLALVDADPGALDAFNAAPGTIAPDEPGPYGAYAQALAEMLREGGIPLEEAFSRVRLRVDEVTRGAFAPWDVSKLDPPVFLLPGNPDARPPAGGQAYAASRARPIAEFPVAEAYAAALERDTLGGYQDFLAAYPDDRLAGRVRALMAARREALTWRRAVSANTPNSYWTYMRRYPRGPHFADARRGLAFLSAPLEPPPRFDVYDFGGLPPPPQAEFEIVDRPILLFDADAYPPPPPPPVYFLPPQPREFIVLPPPPPPQSRGFLPIPIPIPLPYARPNIPQGVVIQQNFGQQGPVGAGQGEASPRDRGQGLGQQLGQPGAPAPAPEPTPLLQGRPTAPLTPAQPSVKTAPPAPAVPVAPAQPLGAPTHALPQGGELPSAQPRAGQSAQPPGGHAPGGGLPQEIKPGIVPPAPTRLTPAQPNVTPPPSAPVVPAQPLGAPTHALPQGGQPPSAEPKGGQPASPPGVHAPGGGLPQEGKPKIAPPAPLTPAQPSVKTAPPAPKTPAAPAQPLSAPTHALPEGHPLPPSGISPPHSPPAGQTPAAKPEAATPVKPAAPAPKPPEALAPKPAPKALEPQAGHPNVPSMQRKAPPQAPAPAPQRQQEMQPRQQEMKAPPPQSQPQVKAPPQAPKPPAPSPANANKPAPKPGEEPHGQEK